MTGTRTAAIVGIGACAASHVMENSELTRLVDTSDEWIRERTGIKRRHIAENESVSSLAVNAAKEALLDAGILADELGLIIVSTMSQDSIMPCTACIVQEHLQAKNACCFDLNAACSGFVSAFATAKAYIASGIVRYALVIGSEVLSSVVDWHDRGSCILFGDGAGAVVLGPSEENMTIPILHADGSQSQALTLKKDGFIGMDGRAVFQFAVRKVPEVITELLKKNHLEKSDIAFYVLHQANRRIVESVAKRMGEPIEKFPMNLAEYGNTSSASIPILLHEMNQKKLLYPGQKIVISGFGGGLTWGADLITWTKENEEKRKLKN